jgi:hypothetical protein
MKIMAENIMASQKKINRIVILSFSVLFFFSVSSFARNIYVSVSSSNPIQNGTLTAPFHTIQQATDIAIFGDVVLIKGGLYREEVKMKTDGVTYQPFDSEAVTITGTEVLSGWTLVSGSVYKTTMNWDAPEANQLFVDQKMIYNAHWPDQTSSNLITPTDAKAEAVTTNGNLFILKDFQFNEPDGRWTGAAIWVNLSREETDGQGWTGTVVSTSQANNTVTVDFQDPPRTGSVPWSVGTGTEYYLYNPTAAGLALTGGMVGVLGAGEWLKDGNDIYVRTPTGAAPQATGSNVVEAKKREFAFHSSDQNKNRNSYTIRGLNLFACSILTDELYKVRRNAIIEDAFNILIDGISAKYISHFEDQTGNWQDQWSARTGIVLSGSNNVIKNSRLQYSAGPAICLIGAGSRILNNTIIEANYSVSNSGAVNTEKICIDCTIGYNTIFDTPIMAINHKGLRNSVLAEKGLARIHHNKIYNFMMRSADSGGIDIVGGGGNGVRVDHNILYNTRNREMTNGGIFALYWDFLLEGQYLVDHNVVYGVNGPMLINSTPLMDIYNNTFISTSATRNIPINGGSDSNEDQFKNGLSVVIKNNIMSFGPDLRCCDNPNLSKATIDKNIINAFGTVANGLFTNVGAGNYQLRSTAFAAINKGVKFPFFDDPISGSSTDLGAYEFGVDPWEAGKPDVLPPIIMPYSREFTSPLTVVIKADTVGAGILTRYTTNGTEPTASSSVYTAPFTVSASAQIKAKTFINSTIVSELATVKYTLVNIPIGDLRDSENPIPVENGIVAEYYEWASSLNYTKLPDFASLTPTRIDTTNVFGLQLPRSNDYFMFQFKGYVEVPADGIYTFYTTSDDASKLFIGDVLVVNNDQLQPATEKSGTIGLKAGKHRITVQFLEAGGGEVLQVSYAGQSIPKTFIPENVLWHVSNPSVTMSPSGGKFPVSKEVTLTGSPTGSTIYYTLNGTQPTTSSPVYVTPLTITNSLTLKAFAAKDGKTGKTLTRAFEITGHDAIISPVDIAFYESLPVSLSSNPVGATIYYTTDGSTPTTSTNVYTTPIVLTSTTLLNAMASKDGVNGEVKTGSFTKLSGPIVNISPVGGSFFDEVVVTITSPTAGAAIHYTTDGSMPTASSTLYSDAITLNTTDNHIIKAIAIKDSNIGEVQTEKYIINIVIITSLDSDEFGPEQLQVFPNPASNGTFTVQFKIPNTAKENFNRLVLSDLRGSIIFEEEITHIKSLTEGKSYSISGLAPGMYIIQLLGKKHHITKRLVIKD